MKGVIGSSVEELDTPCLVIDKKKLIDNIQKLQNEVNAVSKKLRPHVKTHKCLSICKEQIKHGAYGIAAAKVSEAWELAKNGFKNTLITSPVVTPIKIKKLLECLEKDSELTIVVDNLENAENLHNKLINQKLNVLIDIDPLVGRTGISYAEVLPFAKALKKFSNLRLLGIQCYAGNLQHIQDYPERQASSVSIMKEAAQCFRSLKQEGFSVEIFSGSGTGTYAMDLTIPEVTEVQPGSYTVMDAEYTTIGTKENASLNKDFQPALTLLTTVISANQGAQVTCDAGWKALYETPTKPIIINPLGFAYDWFGDEHGKITSTVQDVLPKLGDRLELIVNHCDPTINLYDFFYITENNKVVDVWPIEMRGKSQ